MSSAPRPASWHSEARLVLGSGWDREGPGSLGVLVTGALGAQVWHRTQGRFQTGTGCPHGTWA